VFVVWGIGSWDDLGLEHVGFETPVCIHFFFFLLVELGFEFRVLCLQNKHSTTHSQFIERLLLAKHYFRLWGEAKTNPSSCTTDVIFW
jgi:hypothetical protein